MALASELGVEGRVRILRHVSGDDLPQLYSLASALLHPSFCEGFGNPLAEAMACGCPVVTSDISAMPEVTGDAAILADPHDPAAMVSALSRLLGDKELALQMRDKGLARASELTWESFAKTTLSVYRQALTGPI